MFRKDDVVEILEGIEDLQIERGDIAYVVGDCMNLGCVVIKFDNGYECKFKKDDLRIVKEAKVEKIVVRGWEDILKSRKIYESDKTVSFGNFSFAKHNELEKVVKVLNALGGNFVYKPVEVIDTLEKWGEFQKKIYSKEKYIKLPVNDYFIKINQEKNTYEVCANYHKIEKEFNVDLKILK